jgi:large subunit ribosomal protein L21
MYAIVKVGGKQYRVETGDELVVDRLRADEGAKVALEPLLFRPDKGDPVLGGDDLGKVKVEATVKGHERGKKIRVVKFKPKRGYKRTAGHRSELTRIEIGEIKQLSRKPATPKAGEDSPDAEKPAAAGKKPEAEKQQAAAAAKEAAAAEDTAAAKEAAAKKPAAKKPAAKKPAAKKPAAKKKKEDSDGS